MRSTLEGSVGGQELLSVPVAIDNVRREHAA